MEYTRNQTFVSMACFAVQLSLMVLQRLFILLNNERHCECRTMRSRVLPSEGRGRLPQPSVSIVINWSCERVENKGLEIEQ